jgi:hypothetical protein
VTKERQDETDRLSLRLYLPSYNGTAARITLRADLSPRRPRGTPLPEWTFPSVHFDVALPEEASFPVLFAGADRLVGEQILFLTLGADLEPGEYTVRLALESQPPCLVHCARRLSEGEDERRIYLEEPVRTALKRLVAAPRGAPTAP